MELVPPLELVDAWSGPGPTTYPRHSHPMMELVYHKRGSGFVHLDDGRQLAYGAGSVIHCPAGCGHGEHQDGSGEIIVVQARWRGRPPTAMRGPWASAPARDPWLAGEFAWLGGSAWRRRPATRIEAGFRLAAALTHLVAGDVDAPRAVERHAGQHVTRAQQWIRTHLREASVAGAATAAGVCPDHLARLFRDACNYGPRHAIAQARIDRAKELLASTDGTLQVIAELVGFASARHFCQAFRRIAGTTPGRFRER